MLLGLPFSYYYHSADKTAMLLSAGITFLSGGLLALLFRTHERKPVGRPESFLIVSVVWFLWSVFGTLPFLLSGAMNSFSDAFFEAVSGFTTTGSSVLKDVEVVPHGVLFWRSLTHWIGGMGIVVFTVAFLPFMGAGGSQLFSAEASDPIKEKIRPRIIEAAKILWGIYLLLTVSMTLLLMLGNMSLFDALCHTFGAIGTGGFSTRNQSLAAFSPYCQYIVILFMVMGATNFSLHFYLLSGKWRNVFRDQEYRFYLGVISLATLFIGGWLYFDNGYNVEESFRHSLFQVTSILSTSGFATDNYMVWATPLWMVLFLLMFMGGMAGSTTGGMKQVRVLIAFKAIRTEFKKVLHPSAFIPLKLNGRVIRDEVLRNVFIFLFIYIGTFITASLALMIMGVDFITSIGSTAATLGCIGPGLGETGPVGNFSGIPMPGKWVLSYCMLVGRLELFSVIILFAPAYWKK